MVSASDRELVYSVDVPSTAGGKSFGLDVDYLGNNSVNFQSISVISATAEGTPQITSIKSYKNTVNDTTDPTVSTGGTASLVINGTDLSPVNVETVEMEIVGQEGSDHEIASGNGISEDLALDRINLTILSQGDGSIVCQIPATTIHANSRARVILSSPATHSNGAAEWASSLIDATGQGTVDGLTNFGLTFGWSRALVTHQLNVDPNNGITQLDVTRSLQGQAGPSTEGQAFSVTCRLESALTTDVPSVVAIADSAYGVTLENITVSKSGGSSFEILISGNIPTPGVNNTYPLPSFSDATPARVGLQFANGAPITAVLLGSANWGDNGTGISY